MQLESKIKTWTKWTAYVGRNKVVWSYSAEVWWRNVSVNGSYVYDSPHEAEEEKEGDEEYYLYAIK